MTPFIEKKVKEFDEMFGFMFPDKLKSFLISALTKQAELYKGCVGKFNAHTYSSENATEYIAYENGFNDCADEILNRMEKI